MNYELRPAFWEDNAFLEELFGDVRAAELAALNLPEGELAQLLALQFKAQRMSYAAEFPAADSSIIWAGTYRIGRVLLNETEAEVRLVDIALLTAFREMCVGTGILVQMREYAGERGLPLRLSLRVQNPARRLFERLGFTASVSGDGVSIDMEWIAEPAR